MLSLLGPLISAGASLLGGSMASNAQEEANRLAAAQAAAANRTQMRLGRMNIGLQKLFAQRGIQWKVRDARRAGIHPLYALGASTASYSPVSVGTSTYSPVPEVGMAQGLAAAGQDISRAVTAVQTADERAYTDTVRALDLQRMGLSNELLKSQIMRERVNTVPPVPDTSGLWAPEIAAKAPSAISPLQIMGLRLPLNRFTSSARDFEDRYGEEGPMAWGAGVPALVSDLWKAGYFGFPPYFWSNMGLQMGKQL